MKRQIRTRHLKGLISSLKVQADVKRPGTSDLIELDRACQVLMQSEDPGILLHQVDFHRFCSRGRELDSQ